MFWFLVLPVLLSPLPFGLVHDLAWATLAAVVAALLLLWCLGVALGRSPLVTAFVTLWYVYLPFLLVLLWVALQMSPWLPPGWRNPLWAEAAGALGIATAGTVTLDGDETRSALIRLLTYAAIFWLSFHLSRSARRAEQLFGAFVLACAGYAIYGLVMHLSGAELVLWHEKTVYRDSLTSTFINRNSYATYAGLGLVVTTGLLAQAVSRSTASGLGPRELLYRLLSHLSGRGGWLLLSWSVLAVALMLSKSRAGLASTAIGLAVLFLALGVSRYWTWTRALGFAAPIAAGGFALLLLSGEGTLQRLDVQELAAESRPRTYAITLEAIAERPLRGTGYGTFEDAFRLHQDERIRARVAKAHSSYLENALELGIPAALLLVLAIGGLALRCAVGLRQREEGMIYPAIGLSCTALVAVHALVDFSLQIPAIAANYALIVGAATAHSFDRDRRGGPDPA